MPPRKQLNSKPSSVSSSSNSPTPAIASSRKRAAANPPKSNDLSNIEQTAEDTAAKKEKDLEEAALNLWRDSRPVVLEGRDVIETTEFKQLLLKLANYVPIPSVVHNFNYNLAADILEDSEIPPLFPLPVANSITSPPFRYSKNIGKGCITTSMVVHPSVKQEVVFVGMENGYVGLWELTQLRKESEKISSATTDVEEEEDIQRLATASAGTKLYRWKAHKLKPRTVLEITQDIEREKSRKEVIEKLRMTHEEEYVDQDQKPPFIPPTAPKTLTPEVSCLKLCKSGDALYSGSHDGTIRKLNFETVVAKAVLNITPNKILCFDINGDNLWAGDEEGQLHYRNLSSPISTTPIRKFNIHPSAVRTISINPHPNFSHVAVTAHDFKTFYPGRGDMIFWDLEKLLEVPKTERLRSNNIAAAFWWEETKQGVVSAYFDQSGSRLLETSFGLNYCDRGVSIWNLKERGDNLVPVSDRPKYESPHRLQTSYTEKADVVYLSAEWSNNSTSNPTFTIGDYAKGGLDIGTLNLIPSKHKQSQIEFLHLKDKSTVSKSDSLITATHPRRENRIYSGGNIIQSKREKQKTGYVQFFCGPRSNVGEKNS